MKFYQLEAFEEIYGTLQKIQKDFSFMTIKIAGVWLKYLLESDEGKFLQENILPSDVNFKLGLLNYGVEKNPLAIRRGHNTNDKMSPFMQWYFREYFSEGMDVVARSAEGLENVSEKS